MLDKTFLDYSAIDSAVTKAAHTEFWSEVEDLKYIDTYNFTMNCMWPFMYMEVRGIKVDHENLRHIQKDINLQLEEKFEELCNVTGKKLPDTFYNSSPQCQQYFYVELGYGPYYKDGKVTVDDKALARMVRGTAALGPCYAAKLVQDLRGLRKLKGTYVDMEFDEDGRFRCSINLRGTTTGRISTGKTIRDTGMNMQNLPVVFKRYLIPDVGYFFCELDKRQAEWVVVAYLSGDPNMIRVHEEKLDPHVYTAHLMFGAPEEMIEEETELCGHETDPETLSLIRKRIPGIQRVGFIPRNMTMRQAGKKSNHGLNYDEGYKEFALQNEILESDSKRLVGLYHKVYPGVRKTYHEWVKSQLGDDRTLTNCFGRSRKFLDRWGDKLFKAAYAFLPQSTVVDIINRGINEVYYSDKAEFRPIEQLAQVHDSVLEQIPLSTPTSEVTRLLEEQRKLMTPRIEYLGREFEIHTDLKIGFNWADLVEVKFVDDFHKQVQLISEGLRVSQRTE